MSGGNGQGRGGVLDMVGSLEWSGGGSVFIILRGFRTGLGFGLGFGLSMRINRTG